MADAPASASLYFHNALGRVELVDDAYVRIAWQAAPMDSAALRAVYEHALHLLKRTGLTKVLTDHGQMAPFRAEDREWMTRTWVPRAVAEAGYSRCAIVESAQAFNRLGTRHMVLELGTSTLDVAYFGEAAAADAWLRAE
ncbi:hypothetical protein JAO73_01680 [Hymenobacter sp. BT523]|uniref:hypothetical protein n=1 Tax=Hymenobacter sp. BT523 TaxID=2795725 RepID=UPI0018EA553B|nr:hypothetical protein [Hymenobacter sp. BT523]MBJ6107703.1 hypothetical protein [Hymenobacter sp. BT523]